MVLTKFILGPEWDHGIYHLSYYEYLHDDPITLCGRSIARMECVGSCDTGRDDFSHALSISTGFVHLTRCCLKCHAAALKGALAEREATSETQ